MVDGSWTLCQFFEFDKIHGNQYRATWIGDCIRGQSGGSLIKLTVWIGKIIPSVHQRRKDVKEMIVCGQLSSITAHKIRLHGKLSPNQQHFNMHWTYTLARLKINKFCYLLSCPVKLSIVTCNNSAVSIPFPYIFPKKNKIDLWLHILPSYRCTQLLSNRGSSSITFQFYSLQIIKQDKVEVYFHCTCDSYTHS